MSAWMDWIREAALSRIDTVERDLRAHPERSPSFGRALRELHAALDETEAHPNEELTARDDLWMDYTAALALEMYLAGARDGGRVYHAFITGELPGKTIQERKGEDRTCSDRPLRELAWLREHYRPGVRVKLMHMDDPYRPDLKAGTLGTVIAVDDIGTIHVAWDGGSSLGVVYGADACAVVNLEGGEALDGTDGT